MQAVVEDSAPCRIWVKTAKCVSRGWWVGLTWVSSTSFLTAFPSTFYSMCLLSWDTWRFVEKGDRSPFIVTFSHKDLSSTFTIGTEMSQQLQLILTSTELTGLLGAGCCLSAGKMTPRPGGDTHSLTDTALGERGAETLIRHHSIRCKNWPLLWATWALKIKYPWLCGRKKRAVIVPAP